MAQCWPALWPHIYNTMKYEMSCRIKYIIKSGIKHIKPQQWLKEIWYLQMLYEMLQKYNVWSLFIIAEVFQYYTLNKSEEAGRPKRGSVSTKRQNWKVSWFLFAICIFGRHSEAMLSQQFSQLEVWFSLLGWFSYSPAFSEHPLYLQSRALCMFLLISRSASLLWGLQRQ